MLGVKYTKIDDDYYDELEELLINADVGVNTVMNFMDRLRSRVKKEKIMSKGFGSTRSVRRMEAQRDKYISLYREARGAQEKRC